MSYDEIVLFVKNQIAINTVIDEEKDILTIDKNAANRIAKAVAEKICEGPKPKKIKRFLFVEDGSVDFDDLKMRVEETNPEIALVLYRQGSAKPELVEVEK